MATLCISTTMVLVLLGIVVFTVLTARNLSNYVKENLTVTLMLADDISDNDAHRLCRNLYHRPYSKEIDYVSREQALAEQTKAMGTDPTEFVGVNPFVATLELKLKGDYACSDSLRWIARELKKKREVTDVAYQQDLMNRVNSNISKLSLVLLVLAVLLTFISFSLINNTVRLNVYAQRFKIHTMKLVGASWGFIRRPFLTRAFTVGMTASVLAILILTGALYALLQYEQGLTAVLSWDVIALTAASVLFFGMVITLLCFYISVNHFLRMKAGTLYKI